jgi:hypothetical protein
MLRLPVQKGLEPRRIPEGTQPLSGRGSRETPARVNARRLRPGNPACGLSTPVSTVPANPARRSTAGFPDCTLAGILGAAVSRMPQNARSTREHKALDWDEKRGKITGIRTEVRPATTPTARPAPGMCARYLHNVSGTNETPAAERARSLRGPTASVDPRRAEALHFEPCRPYSGKGRTGCSSILRIGTNRFMSMSSVMPIAPSSGSIRYDWPEAAVLRRRNSGTSSGWWSPIGNA